MHIMFNVIKPNDRSSNWEDPPVFFNEGLVGMTLGETWESSEERQDAPFEWGYIYFPLGPNATEYNALKTSGGGYVIPAGVEDPEIVYQIWEDLQIWRSEERRVGKEGRSRWARESYIQYDKGSIARSWTLET